MTNPLPVQHEPDWRDQPPTVRVRRLRQERGWTQAEMARHCSPPMTHAAISDVERGRTQMTVKLADELASVFGVTRNDLLAHTEHRSPENLETLSLRYNAGARKLLNDLGSLSAVLDAVYDHHRLIFDDDGILSMLQWAYTLGEKALDHYKCDCHPHVESDTNAAIHDDTCASGLEEHVKATISMFDQWRKGMRVALSQVRDDYPGKKRL